MIQVLNQYSVLLGYSYLCSSRQLSLGPVSWPFSSSKMPVDVNVQMRGLCPSLMSTNFHNTQWKSHQCNILSPEAKIQLSKLKRLLKKKLNSFLVIFGLNVTEISVAIMELRQFVLYRGLQKNTEFYVFLSMAGGWN